MKHSLRLSGFGLCLLMMLGCSGQPRESQRADTDRLHDRLADARIGGPCETCELMYLGIPPEIDSMDVSPGAGEPGDLLLLTGTIYAPDGVTPAAGVILYYWQTDSRGYYSPADGMQPGAKRHGHIRGWVKTGITGRYHIETIRPAPYPGQDIPAHIHVLILEPGLSNEYYVDDINFDDDPLLLPFSKKHSFENRGGSGVVRLLREGKKQVAEHDVILGLHIPGHPSRMVSSVSYGLSVGEPQPSFRPFHAYGPDMGTRVCPVCKYGRHQGVLYFAGNHPDWRGIRAWLSVLEVESERRNGQLNVFFVLGNEAAYDSANRVRELMGVGEELKLRRLALTFVPSLQDRESEVHLNKLASNAPDAMIIYRNGNIVDRFDGLPPTEENIRLLRASLDRTQGDFLHLPAYYQPLPDR